MIKCYLLILSVPVARGSLEVQRLAAEEDMGHFCMSETWFPLQPQE